MLFYALFRNDPHVRKLRPDEVLYREDEVGDSMYVVLSGRLAVSGRGRRLETVEPGGIVGEMALLQDRSLRSTTVTALTECEFVEVDEKRFMDLVAEMPLFALEVMKVMAQRLHQAEQAAA